MPLHENRGRRTDGDDQIGWLVSMERVKIIDKWTV